MKKIKTIVIIGKNSYLATGLPSYLTAHRFFSFSHTTWSRHRDILAQADVVINFAIHPDTNKRIIPKNDIIDIKIAKSLPPKCRYIFLSSRRVYGSSDTCHTYTEASPVVGDDAYSINKLCAERELWQLLGNRLTILRISNVIGEKTSKQNYRTFMGWLSRESTRAVWHCDWNPRTVKDFISKDFLHRCLARIVALKVSGIFNLSAGFGMEIRDILKQAAREKPVIFADRAPLHDQFILDNRKLLRRLKVQFTRADLIGAIHNYFD